MTWRDKARPIIARVIDEVGTDDRKRLRVALRAAYPFGSRQYHPYKIWCHEIRVQLGEVSYGKSSGIASCRGQKNMFEEENDLDEI